jgi:gamma-tubulin complex component 2
LIRYEEGYDPLDEAQRIRGASWSIDPSLGMSVKPYEEKKLIDIDPSLLSVVERLLPLATAFTSVEAYMELRSALNYMTLIPR